MTWLRLKLTTKCIRGETLTIRAEKAVIKVLLRHKARKAYNLLLNT